nr:uncharacterized protein LOC111417911 [Onthophagus taurus]
MLASRVVQTKAKGHTVQRAVVKGCPQDWVLSPLLWCLIVDDLIRELNNKYLFTVGYADDVAILLRGKPDNFLCYRMQQALKLVERWCEEHTLSVNPKKTETVLFTKQKKLGHLTPPNYCNNPLTFAPEVKYLGVILDKGLTWTSHISCKIKKATIVLTQCRRAIGNTWGLNPKVTMWIYTSVIRPMVAHGAIVWCSALKHAYKATLLHQLQRLACLLITGAMRSTPTIAMETMLNVLPLDIFIREVAVMALLRLRSVNEKQVVKMGIVRSKLWSEAVSKQPLLKARTDYITPTFLGKPHFGIETIPQSNSSSGKTLTIYTDGSKKAGGSGAGIFSHDLQLHLSTSLGSYCTTAQAELIAINIAADAIIDSKKVGRNVVICTDSRQAMLAVGRHHTASSLVKSCRQSLEEANVYNNVTIKWRKGHIGIKGHDHADRLAKRAANKSPISPEPFVPLAVNTASKLINSISHRAFCDRWDGTAIYQNIREYIMIDLKIAWFDLETDNI